MFANAAPPDDVLHVVLGLALVGVGALGLWGRPKP
jgi:MYXO-CTERM domain-containing protein